METTSASIIRIDHGVVSSNDLGKSLAFFTDALGTRFERLIGATPRGLAREVPMLVFFTLANHHGFGVALQSETMARRKRVLEGPVWGFELDEKGIEGAIEHLKKLGIPFEGPVEYPAPSPLAASLFVADPFDNLYELSTRRNGDSSKNTGQGALGLRRISHVRLDVLDLKLAERWYSEVLGLKLAHAVPGDRQLTFEVPVSGQLFVLQEVEKMAERSLFYRGQHVDVRVPVGRYGAVAARIDNPERYQGHVATRIPWPEANVPTVYFYDPFYNRLQLSESKGLSES
jgi:catechol 2,3-dioxygenase-like lactoylglutathione lyase family enzyme